MSNTAVFSLFLSGFIQSTYFFRYFKTCEHIQQKMYNIFFHTYSNGRISKGERGMTKYLGIHETLEVHELLAFKNLCLTKSVTMSGLAQDEELKSILSKDVETGKQHIQQLENFLTTQEEHHE